VHAMHIKSAKPPAESHLILSLCTVLPPAHCLSSLAPTSVLRAGTFSRCTRHWARSSRSSHSPLAVTTTRPTSATPSVVSHLPAATTAAACISFFPFAHPSASAQAAGVSLSEFPHAGPTAVIRFLADPSDWTKCRTCMPPGQSGQVGGHPPLLLSLPTPPRSIRVGLRSQRTPSLSPLCWEGRHGGKHAHHGRTHEHHTRVCTTVGALCPLIGTDHEELVTAHLGKVGRRVRKGERVERRARHH